MRHVKLNIRLVTFLAAVVVAVVAAGSLAPGARQAYADYPDPTGVFCTDATPFGVDGIILIRFDLDGNDVAMSIVAYIPDGGASSSCQFPGSDIGVPPEPQTGDRPTLTGKWVAASHTIVGETCSEDTEFAGIEFEGWTRFIINFAFNADPLQKSASPTSFAIHTFQDPGADPEGDTTTCTDDPPNTAVIEVPTNGKYLDGPGGDKANYNSDWDNDGRRDWDELASPPELYTFTPLLCDPFVANDNCAISVGGIAELPAVAGAPLEAGSSGTNVGLIAAYAAAAAAGALALGGAAWYARRRIR